MKNNRNQEYLSKIYSERFKYNFYSVGQDDYLTVLLDDRVVVFKNEIIVLEKVQDNKHITGACYFENKLFYTQKDENKVYCLDDDTIKTTELNEYGSVVILKCVNGDDFILALYVINGENKKIILYDYEKKKEVCILPTSRIGFRDVAIDRDKNLAVLLCKEKEDISVYEGDDDSKITFLVSVNIENCQIEDSLKVIYCYDNFNETYLETVHAAKNMKFPLWDFFTRYFPISKGFSSNGKYILYYCKDFEVLVLSKYENGEIYRLFHIPKDLKYNDKIYFYFNEKTNILSIIENRKLNKFKLIQDQKTEEIIDEVNDKYKNYHDSECWEFSEIVFKAIDCCKCVELDGGLDL